MNNPYHSLQEVVCQDRRSGRDRRDTDVPIPINAMKRSCDDRRSKTARRERERCYVKDFTFVQLWSESDEDLGQLLDINDRGIAFRYLSHDKKPRNFSVLSIALSDGHFPVAKIPFKTTSDVEMVNGSAFRPKTFRRSGAQFGQLTPNQLFELDDFLTNNVFGKA